MNLFKAGAIALSCFAVGGISLYTLTDAGEVEAGDRHFTGFVIGDTHFENHDDFVDSGARCGTRHIDEIEQAGIEADLEARLMGRDANDRAAASDIPIVFHIMMNESGTSGAVNDQQVAAQLEVINNAYAG